MDLRIKYRRIPGLYYVFYCTDIFHSRGFMIIFFFMYIVVNGRKKHVTRQSLLLSSLSSTLVYEFALVGD